MNPWIKVLVLSIGGAAGVNARYWQGHWMLQWVSPRFPWATFSINVLGSFAIGFLSLLILRMGLHSHSHLWAFIVVGFLGGYTTFSSFSLDALLMIEQGRYSTALLYLVGSVTAGMVAVAAGAGLARLLLGGVE